MKDIQPRRLISFRHIKETLASFTIAEKTFFSVSIVILAIALFGLLVVFNQKTLLDVPRRGGSFTEGVVGTPRFINPLLAQKEVDRDLSMLMYSGLLRLDVEGNLVPDLAESYELNTDGTTYTVILKKDLTFHDGTPLTADDVLYTSALAQNGLIKSVVQSTWNNVYVEKVDEHTVTFTISEAYVPFAYNLTLGILPKHLWEKVPVDDFLFSELNTRPVGSGPYRLAEIKETNGIPNQYTLQSFDNFSLGKPFIDTINVVLFSDEEALQKANDAKDITNAYDINPRNNQKSYIGTLPRTFSVYFNQNEAMTFAQKAVREALATAINKDELVTNVLQDKAEVLMGALPNSLYPADILTTKDTSSDNIERARLAFEELGYVYNSANGLLEKDGEPITFALTTADVPQLVATGEFIVNKWKLLGIDATLEIYDSIDLTQRIIRPRDYEALLFGQVLPHGLDLYAFWHSSQRNDPGLNVALYTNVDVDKAVTSLRKETDISVRTQFYSIFSREIKNDVPAIFLFSPQYTYTYPENITVVIPKFIVNSSERFAQVHTWYTETDSVWPFIKNLNN